MAKNRKMIHTVEARKALEPSGHAYFYQHPGLKNASIGFRKRGPVGTDEGTWQSRVLLEDGYRFKSHGAQPDFDTAARLSLMWAQQVQSGAVRSLLDGPADQIKRAIVELLDVLPLSEQTKVLTYVAQLCAGGEK